MTVADQLRTDLRDGLQHAVAVSEAAVLLVGSGRPARIEWANPAAADLLARAADALVGCPLPSVLSWEPAGPLLHPVRVQRRRGRLNGADGRSRAVAITSHPVPGHELWTVSATLLGPALRHRDAELADAAERRLLALAERTPVPTVLSDVGLRLAHVNDAFARLVGMPAEAVLGTGWLHLVHEDDLAAVTGCAEHALHGEHADTMARILTATGEQRWVDFRLAPSHTPGQGPGFVGTAEDVTDRRAMEHQLAYQARHDALTGLPNRAALFEHLESRLDRLQPDGTRPDPELAVLFLDLDNFKMINDSLGHDAGDAMLVDVANRLQSAVRDEDVVTRMGGDEFVVICHRVRDDAEAELLAGRVLEVCTQPLHIGTVRVHPSASMGVARAGALHSSVQDLLRDADIAMYEAKAAGKNRFAVCDSSARETARDTLQLLGDLRAAIDDGGLRVAYQPVVDLTAPPGSALPAVEALARWEHPTRGTVPPDVFIPLAESHRLIGPLTERVLDTACAQVVRWRDELGALAPRRVNVNVSARQLPDLGLVGVVQDALARHRLPASVLCLEITESAIMAEPAASRDTLLALRAAGVAVAIDDFGVGYSSLAHLRRLPVDSLKIDRSFVTELGSPDGGAVAAAVVSLAQALGLSAVAEGVETPEQAEQLRALGCATAQGWLWSPALNGADLRDWVLAGAGRTVA